MKNYYVGRFKWVEEYYPNLHIYMDELSGDYYAARLNEEGRATFTKVKKANSSWVPA